MIIKWIGLDEIYVVQVDPKTTYLLNGLYMSTSNLTLTQIYLTQTCKTCVGFKSCCRI